MNDENQTEPTAEPTGLVEMSYRLELVIDRLSQVNKAPMPFHAHKTIERAMIDVGWVRDRIHEQFERAGEQKS